MKFDVMCRLAEKGSLPGLASKLRYVSLLLMPGNTKAIDRFETLEACEIKKEVESGFRLLWKAVAVEDDISCVFLERLGSYPTKPHARLGQMVDLDAPLNSTKRVNTAAVGLERGDTFMYASARGIEGLYVLVSTVMVYLGSFSTRASLRDPEPLDNAPLFARTAAVHSVLETRTGVESISSTNQEFLKRVETNIANEFLAAIGQCMNASCPGKWILREVVSPKAIRDPVKAPKIPRSHERPRWIVIDDKERVRYFRRPKEEEEETGPSTPTYQHPTPHPRRAHYRHIGENEDGTRRHTWVRACWVGSTEAEIRGARYKVELEL